MRDAAIFLIGIGSMVAAYVAFALAMTDDSPISAPPWRVPAVVVAAGALTAIIDRGLRALVILLFGATTVVLVFAVWLRITQGPDVEWIPFAVIGIGLALTALTVGFVPAALIGRLAHRNRSSA